VTAIQRSIVVDASIARAAGTRAVTSSITCRQLLLAITVQRHKVVLTPEIKAEWKRHQSNFSRKWLVDMVSRKLFVQVSPAQHGACRTEASAATSPNREAMEKDLHLIEAALITDRLVLSLDDKARALFCGLASSVGIVRTIDWRNPLKHDCCEWLKAGAGLQREHQLRIA